MIKIDRLSRMITDAQSFAGEVRDLLSLSCVEMG